MPIVKKRKNGRSKGQRGERAVAKMFSNWWGAEFARTPMSGGFHTPKFREDWNAEGDLVTPDPTFPFSVECKWHEGWTLDKLITAPKCEIWEWWKQTKEQTNEGKIPLLVFKRNNMPWYYMLPLMDSINIEGNYITCTDPEHKNVAVGLLSNLFETEKDTWL